MTTVAGARRVLSSSSRFPLPSPSVRPWTIRGIPELSRRIASPATAKAKNDAREWACPAKRPRK